MTLGRIQVTLAVNTISAMNVDISVEDGELLVREALLAIRQKVSSDMTELLLSNISKEDPNVKMESNTEISKDATNIFEKVCIVECDGEITLAAAVPAMRVHSQQMDDAINANFSGS